MLLFVGWFEVGVLVKQCQPNLLLALQRLIVVQTATLMAPEEASTSQPDFLRNPVTYHVGDE